MSCMCAEKLTDLLKKLLGLGPPAVKLPASVEALASMSLPSSGGPTASSLNVSANLPALGLSPMALAQLSATASAASSVQAGLGVDLTAPDASAKLSASINAANANIGAFLPLAGLDAMPFMALSTLGSVVLGVKAAFGVNLMSPGGPAGLNAALNASVAAPAPPPMPANGQAYASLAATADAFGVSLSDPNAMQSLAGKANAVANLSIPALAFSPATLLNPLAILAALANMLGGLGLNPFDSGYAEGLAKVEAQLPALGGISIPASFAAGATSGAGSSSALAGLDLDAMASLNTSAMANFQAPNLGPLSALASFSAQCSAAGLPVAATSACSPSCPMPF